MSSAFPIDPAIEHRQAKARALTAIHIELHAEMEKYPEAPPRIQNA